jgi:hypothetical protein
MKMERESGVRSRTDDSTYQLIHKLVETLECHALPVITHTLGHLFFQDAVGEYAL